MLGDVVKSKSKLPSISRFFIHLIFIPVIIVQAVPCIKKIYFYVSLSNRLPIIVKEVNWLPPLVEVKFYFTSYGTPYHQSERLKYLKVHSLPQFEAIKNNIKEKINTGYYSPKKPTTAYLSRPFPFKKTIFFSLSALLYTILLGLETRLLTLFYLRRAGGKERFQKIET